VPLSGAEYEVREQVLAKLRAEVRSTDTALIGSLARRIRLVSKIGLLKQELGIGVIDVVAEKSVIENFVTSAVKAGVEGAVARRLAELVIESSTRAQMRSRPPEASRDSFLKQFSETMLRAEKEGRKLIRLDVGEPRFRTPSVAVREAKRRLGQTPTIPYGSSAGLTELVDAIVARLNDQYGTGLRRSNVLIVPGARFGIFVAMRTALSSLDRVVVCQPAWPAYESCASLVGARSLKVSASLEDSWDVDLTTLEEQLKLKPKMLVLNSPNNPTGKVLSAKKLREVTELAKRTRTIVLSDEVYASYCTVPASSILEYSDVESIYVNSFSKELSMTGWRVAYVVADERKIEKMRAIVETTLTNVPEFVQRGALAALKDPSGRAARARYRIGSRVKAACAELAKGVFDFYVPDGGFYVFPRIKGRKIDSEKFARYLFTKHGVGILPGTVFGSYRNFLRLAITESETAVRTGIKRIVKAIHQW